MWTVLSVLHVFNIQPSNPIASRLYLNLLMWEHFPCLSMLYEQCGKWEWATVLGRELVKMEFASLFYCMAINLDLGEAVCSWPHHDRWIFLWGSVLYLFLVLLIPFTASAMSWWCQVGFFDDGELAWLVNLESGLFVQLPPGAFFAFPSALLTHWSGDKKGGCPIILKPATKGPLKHTPSY